MDAVPDDQRVTLAYKAWANFCTYCKGVHDDRRGKVVPTHFPALSSMLLHKYCRPPLMVRCHKHYTECVVNEHVGTQIVLLQCRLQKATALRR